MGHVRIVTLGDKRLIEWRLAIKRHFLEPEAQGLPMYPGNNAKSQERHRQQGFPKSPAAKHLQLPADAGLKNGHAHRRDPRAQQCAPRAGKQHPFS